MAASEDTFIERVDLPAGAPQTVLQYEHFARYQYARSVVRGDVLDIACGTGYGSQMLARESAVVGIDKDDEAVRLAAQRSEGRFFSASVPPIPIEDHSFDAVVSFETLEHIADDVGFVRELRRVLRPGGVLLMSTPNKAVTSPSGPPRNPWHEREYTHASVVSLVRDAGFEHVDVRAQVLPPADLVGRVRRAVSWRVTNSRPPGGPTYRIIARALFGWLEVAEWDGTSEPLYWVLVCR